MSAFLSEVLVDRLPVGVKNHLAACLARVHAPCPLWSIAKPIREGWKVFLPVGLVFGAVLVAISGGEPVEWPWIFGWFLAALAIAWGIFGWMRSRKASGIIPLNPGTYLFATDLLDVGDEICHRADLDGLIDARLHTPIGSAGARDLLLVFPDQTINLHLPGHQSALNMLKSLNQARQALLDARAVGAWNRVGELDPLYEARYGGSFVTCVQPVVDRSWEQMTRRPWCTRWLTSSPTVFRNGVIAAALAAPALWSLQNFLLDESAFSRARSANSVASWKRYLASSSHQHRAEVYSRRLPEAALRAARIEGSVSALQGFLTEYGHSSVADEARDEIRAVFAATTEKVSKETDPSMRDAMVALLKYLEEHGSSKVEVRFGASSRAFLADWETLLNANLDRDALVNFAPIAARFSDENLSRHEDGLIGRLQKGFARIGVADVLVLRRGPAFYGSAVGFDKPSIAIQWAIAQPDAVLVDVDHRELYLSLPFEFQLTLFTPGNVPTRIAFQINPGEVLPTNVAHKSWYDAMIDIAFQEFQRRIASSFFPRHMPERLIALGERKRSPESAPNLPAKPRSSATGFCISRDGYVVTARHFTRGRKSFKVVTRDGKQDAELVREDPSNDLAVLKVQGSLPALPIRRNGETKVGEKVATVGFPNPEVQGYEPKFNDGIVSSRSGIQDDRNTFQISVALQPGNSGGPLVDMQGNVVGVVVAKLDAMKTFTATGNLPENVNYAVKSELLMRFLESIPGIGELPVPIALQSPSGDVLFDIVSRATVLIEGY